MWNFSFRIYLQQLLFDLYLFIVRCLFSSSYCKDPLLKEGRCEVISSMPMGGALHEFKFLVGLSTYMMLSLEIPFHLSVLMENVSIQLKSVWHVSNESYFIKIHFLARNVCFDFFFLRIICKSKHLSFT